MFEKIIASNLSLNISGLFFAWFRYPWRKNLHSTFRSDLVSVIRHWIKLKINILWLYTVCDKCSYLSLFWGMPNWKRYCCSQKVSPFSWFNHPCIKVALFSLTTTKSDFPLKQCRVFPNSPDWTFSKQEFSALGQEGGVLVGPNIKKKSNESTSTMFLRFWT